ncbi:MAG: hypothetical protein VX766_06710, partial [Pseudomonadota bacterium]|nr:hypothetical protein [Pseudomonadota bacterium]
MIVAVALAMLFLPFSEDARWDLAPAPDALEMRDAYLARIAREADTAEEPRVNVVLIVADDL